MIVFHFCWDLSFLRITRADFYADPFWTTQRTVIVGLFVFCAGVGQALARAQRQSWPRFWLRWVQVAGCAALVSAGSWLMAGPRFISFGVLHGIAVMLIIARLTAGWGALLWFMGAIAIALPQLVQHPFFDSRLTNWMGLVTHKPLTEDFAPVLPWIGVMWWGVAAGHWALRHRREWLTAGVPTGLRTMVVLGRWSLSIYMLHQPLLLGLIFLVQWILSASSIR